MKLRNKKTGEIMETGDTFSHMKGRYLYKSLAELNEDWEDYDETETYFINEVGGINVNALADKKARENFYKQLKAIGNYFETEEEAEKAVEKLKAWKRLKDDYHVRFDLDFVKNTISFTYSIDGTLHSVIDDEPIVFEDMKTIFGGEE